MLQVNGVNTTHSTHDEVVNIVRRSGGTLAMKVITPLIKPKSVSEQIKGQFTPVSTPDTQKKEGDSPKPCPLLGKSSNSPILLGTFQPTLSAAPEVNDRETVIGGNASPVLPRSGKLEWDSQGEESPTIPRKTSYPAASASSMSHSSSNLYEDGGRWGSPNTGLKRSAKSAIQSTSEQPRAKTLPPLSKHDPPKLSDYADSGDSEESDEDETSSFANALRESRAKIQRKASIPRSEQRERSNTGPSPSATPPLKSSPLLVKRSMEKGPDDKMSPLQMELLKASQERSSRMSSNKSKLTEVTQKEMKEGDRNSLADVLSRRLDSMSSKMTMPDDSDDSFEDSPRLIPGKKILSPQTKSNPDNQASEQDAKPVSKAPPPSVKPKPSKKERQERPESPLVGRSVMQSDANCKTSLPWEVKLKSAPRKEPEPKTPPAVNSGVDWKSALKTEGSPVRKTRASQYPPEESPEQSSPSVKLRKASASSRDHESMTSANAPVSQEEDLSSFVLPPPLPDNNKRLSFIDVDPPDAFMLEMDQTSTDAMMPTEPESGVPSELFAPPPFLSPPRPASPLPPPLPDSSPPPKIPSSSPTVFVFPDNSDRSRESTKSLAFSVPSPIHTPEIIDLPSPLPSPTRERAAFSTSPLPPPAFGSSDDSSFDAQKPYQMENTSTFTPIILESEDRADTPPPLPSDPPPPPPSDPPPPPPSESPPPLPSTDPPIFLESDISYEQDGTSPGGVHSTSTSPGSSPRSYNISDEPPTVPEQPPKAKDAESVKVAPLVAKKPKRGFYIPSPENSPLKEVATVKQASAVPETTFPVKETTPETGPTILKDEQEPSIPVVEELATPAKEVSSNMLQIKSMSGEYTFAS